MGILDGIVEWIAEQIMAGLDLVTTSVLGDHRRHPVPLDHGFGTAAPQLC